MLAASEVAEQGSHNTVEQSFQSGDKEYTWIYYTDMDCGLTTHNI